MQEMKTILEHIELKVRKLLHRNEHLAKENKNLLEENIKLKKEIQERFYSTPAGISYNDEPASAHSDEEKVNVIKNELDKYLIEVDECLKLLES